MNQYKNQFEVTRISGEKADTLSLGFPPKSNYIIVLVKDQIYKLVVTGDDGSRVSNKELQRFFSKKKFKYSIA